jgi:hypothetical protein
MSNLLTVVQAPMVFRSDAHRAFSDSRRPEV